EKAWRRWLHDGVVPDTAFAPKTVALRPAAVTSAAAVSGETVAGLDIQFRNDPSVLDGRFGNNGWLQELPKPITKLTWDNAVFVSPTTASAMGIEPALSMQAGERGHTISRIVEVRYKDRIVRGPIFSVVGHPDESITVHLGYGRRRGGHL